MIQKADDWHARIETFQVLIPIVGPFHARKTSLVNTRLQRPEGEGLPTDIVPQTALATEIHFADSADGEGIEGGTGFPQLRESQRSRPVSVLAGGRPV